jgi:hypothetical protein
MLFTGCLSGDIAAETDDTQRVVVVQYFDTATGKVTGCRLDDWGTFLAGHGLLFLPTTYRLALVPTHPPSELMLGCFTDSNTAGA